MAKSKSLLVSMHLSIRLLREGKSIQDAFRENHGMTEVKSKNGQLFIEQSPATSPSWLNFIKEFSISPPEKLENKSCGALLFLHIPDDKGRTRIMVLAFGGGHHALNANSFERNFGLRVALNSIARENLKNIDIATLDITTFNKRIQASRKADLDGFGVDIYRDLLRLAGGIPTDKNFAKSLAGKDALTLQTQTSSSDVIDKCKRALRLFKEDYYKKNFAWIDFISPVLEKDRIEFLDSLAFLELSKLVKGRPSDLHICLPDIISPEDSHEIGYFGAGLRPGSKETFLELTIEDYVSQLQAGDFSSIADMNELKSSHEVCVVIGGKKDKEHRRKIYECFVYEIMDKGSTYVIFNGDWYLVDSSFFKGVEEYYNSILSSAPFLPSSPAKNEKELIEQLNKDLHLLNLDQAKLSPTGAPGANLEPCDFFSHKKQFIHLKDGGSSAPISHLWNQGIVAAEAFSRDENFRKKLRDEVVKRQKKDKKTGFETLLPDGRSKANPGDYTIIFGILRDPYQKTGKVGLPFFSKVSLRAAANRIKTMSYNVELHLIKRV